MSDAGVNPYGQAAGAEGSAGAAADNNAVVVNDPGAVRKGNTVGGFFSALVSKDTWTNIGNSTADAAKKAYSAVATNKTLKHLTKGSTWADKEQVSGAHRCFSVSSPSNFSLMWRRT